MSQRKRVLEAINHVTSDIIPHQLDLTDGMKKKLENYYSSGDFLYTIANNHLVREKYKNHQRIDNQSYKDIYGVVWQGSGGGDIGVVKNYLLGDSENSTYSFPKVDNELIIKKCKALVENFPLHFKIFEISLSFFERAWSLRGMEDLLVDMVTDEDKTSKLLDKILEINLEIIETAAKFEIDCILLGDDWGQQKGLIMGYPLWAKYIKPRLSIMYSGIKKHNLYVGQHSCGDNNELFEDLIEMGLDIYNTFQPEIYNVVDFKRKYGNYITIYGGVSTQSVFASGTPEQVYNETKRIMHILGESGGLIIAPTHQITEDVSVENVEAFLKAVKEQ